MRNAQPHPDRRYYGSTLVVLNAARAAGASADVWVSDSDPEARRAFRDCDPSIHDLTLPGFSPSDGFSILGADFDADLLLLDPLGDFLPRHAENEVSRIARASSRIACVLFVLNLDPTNRVGQRYQHLRSMHLPEAWSMHCPKLQSSGGLRGESRYEVDILLAWHRLADHPRKDALRNRLRLYAEALSAVLEAEVAFSEGNHNSRS